MLYKFIATISTFLRVFVVPNPFLELELGLGYNILAEPLLHIITFSIVGSYYRKGIESPAVGSILYLFFYWVHTGLLMLMGHFAWNKVIIAIIVIAYLGVHIVINRIKERLFYY